MPFITIHTEIKAQQEIVFDLARSIDLHKVSMKNSNEKAIAGVTSGLIELGESVTWRAKHFGVYQTLSSKITQMEKSTMFVDEMIDGAFKSFKHVHIFIEQGNVTLMKDEFYYEAPLGIFGNLANSLFLKRYMTNLLKQRNAIVKEFAESSLWKEVLA